VHLWVLFKGMARFTKPNDFMIKIQEFKLVALHKAKQPHQDKVFWQIVESM
jgi:hypothetical protein